MSARRIVDEIEILNSTQGAKAFNLIHDNLTTDKKFVKEIAALIRGRDLDVRWGFSSRIDTIDLEVIQVVAEAGCDYVFFGIESGSAKTQRTMRKRLKLTRVHEVIRQCIDHGITPATSFILGFPDEDLDDVSATIRLAFDCRILGARRSFLNLLSAYTGTPVMKDAMDSLVFDREAINTSMVSYLEEKHYQVIEADRFIFANYYSLDYSHSPLNAAEYRDLVDFYTICLFKFRHIISFLINDLRVDPIVLFTAFRDRLASLTVTDRNHLNLDLSFDDVRSYVDPSYFVAVQALLLFDQALWLAGTPGQAGILFSGPIVLDAAVAHSATIVQDKIYHYLLSHSGTEVNATALEPQISELYELQGLYAVRCNYVGPEIDA